MHGLVLAHMGDAAEAARLAGRHAEAKAARRELVRKAKAFTEDGGYSDSGLQETQGMASQGI